MSERQVLETDIVCVGFGPAVAGFLAALAPRLADAAGAPALGSSAVPGLPLQVTCFERADGPGFGVSGAVTRARAIRASFPDADLASVPMAAPVTSETLAYLLDPIGASRRSAGVRAVDALVSALDRTRASRAYAVELPHVPSFLRKDGGFVLSIGQFMGWVSERLMASASIQLWPASPVAAPLLERGRVVGVRLADQGTDRHGHPAPGFMPGMDVRAALTVVGDGPVGTVGRRLDESIGTPRRHARRDWAVGMKMVVELRPGAGLAPGTVIHTVGYPEPEIFGFMYVHPGGVASVGIFVPSWFRSPVRTAYRYLQHWMLHPYLWRHLQGATLRSWGAKSIQESGIRGEPFLAGDGYARIGEGSGSTNVLSGSGIDEAWATGECLARGVVEIVERREPFTRENLERTYVAGRRASWVESAAREAADARNGFGRGVMSGLFGMAVAGFSRGRIRLPAPPRPRDERVADLERYFADRIGASDVAAIRDDCWSKGTPLHDSLMDRAGWPPIPFDGRLLVSHQDALMVGGKVYAPPGYADHVVFESNEECRACRVRTCIEACSGQAILPGADGVPAFDREKCVHCGACEWNCPRPSSTRAGRSNVEFLAGAGGLHSAEN